jgi:DNA polymerase III subunit alpha
MPIFPIPAEFGTEADFQIKYPKELLREEFNDETFERLGGFEKVVRITLEAAYLKHLTYIGAKERYGDPVPEDVVVAFGI